MRAQALFLPIAVKAFQSSCTSILLRSCNNMGNYKHQLEVFDDNTKAIEAYRSSGFNVHRNMVCYKGTPSAVDSKNYTIKEIALDVKLFQTFCDIKPSWQNDFPSIQRNLDDHKVIGIEENGEVIAYAIYTKSGRVKQCAVQANKRRKGLATQFFEYIKNDIEVQELTVTCIERNEAIDNFMQKIGLRPFITLDEMILIC